MKYGLLYISDYRPEVHGSESRYYSDLLEEIELAEALGFEGVFFAEHYIGGYGFPAPAVLATAAAQRTNRIRLGTGVALLPLTNPVQLAEQYAMVDVLSQGRLDFGIGRGVLKAEYDLFGIDEAESQERYQEALEVVRKTWTQHLMTHVGKHYQFYDIAPHPHPVQRPTPPIWAACAASPESFAWAGAQGFNPMLAPFAFVDRSMLVKLLGIYWQARAEAGFDSRSVDVLGVYHLYLDTSDAKAQEIGERHYREYWKFFAKLNQKAGFTSKAYSRYRGSLDELLLATPYKDLDENDCVMFGSPEHCAERLTRASKDFGITYPIFEVNFGGLGHEDAMRSIEMLAEQVMPKVAG